MRRTPAASRAVALVLLLAACGGGGTPEPARPGPGRASAAPRSIVLVTLDTTRADRLGAFGGTGGLTPFLDGFAKGATRFTGARTPVPLTLPSHVSIMSGWLPRRHGVTANVDLRVSGAVPLLAEELRGAGYATAAFVSASVLLSRYGLDRGFDVYDDSFHDPKAGLYQAARASATLDRALAWARGAKAPSFLWVHLFDPHTPYAPPAGFERAHPYDGEIAYMDAELGRFFDAWGKLPGSDAALVVIAADHGESLGEHGEEDHGVFLYEAVAHVPLLVRLPGEGAGRTVADLVGLQDVAPTLREAAGLPPVAGDGASLLPLLAEGAPRGDRVVVVESEDGLRTFGWAPLSAATDGRFKLVDAPRPELYDLAADPAEARNVLAEQPAVAARLRAALARHREIAPPGAALAAGTTAGEREELASLGYLAGSGGDGGAQGSVRRDPKDVIQLRRPIQQASALVAQGQHDEARRIVEGLLPDDGDNPALHLILGQALAPGEPDAAARAFRRATELAPSYDLAWQEWVTMLLDAGRTAEAATVATEALGRTSDPSGILELALAEGAIREGRDEATVLGHVETALGRNPDLARAFMVRGIVHLTAGRTAEGEADLGRVWEHASMADVERWQKDPLFAPVFAARPPSP